jgi:D-sedoheptulose 7-phosphate isomerase
LERLHKERALCGLDSLVRINASAEGSLKTLEGIEIASPRHSTILIRAGPAMNGVLQQLTENLQTSIELKRQLLADERQLASFQDAVELVTSSYRRGGRIYAAGNGGSASDAQHLVAELVCKLSKPRAPLAAEALTADCVTMTAIANDFDFESIFARQLECKATPNDVFLAMSTSGESRNILRALEQCRLMDVPSILFGGRGGGRALTLADVSIIVPGANSCQVQELHIVLYHTLVACVESALFEAEPANESLRISTAH